MRPHSRLTKTLSLLLLMLLSAAVAAQARWDERFTVRKKVTIDTGATGTAIGGPIGTATVLVTRPSCPFTMATRAWLADAVST